MTFKRWLFVSVVLYGVGVVWGLNTPGDAPGLLNQNAGALEALARSLAAMPPAAILLFIYMKNLIALLVSFALSPLFGLVPALVLVVNGGVLGLVVLEVANRKSWLFVLAGTLPHGILELPAFFIGEAAALSFGAAVTLSLFSLEKRAELGANFRQNLKRLALSAVLLLPAALIETFVTPLLAR